TPSAAAGRGVGGATHVIPVWPIFKFVLRCPDPGTGEANPALSVAALRKSRRSICLVIFALSISAMESMPRPSKTLSHESSLLAIRPERVLVYRECLPQQRGPGIRLARLAH